MNIFDHRLINQAQIAVELKRIIRLTSYGHYLDEKTYIGLMHLGQYLYNVSEYTKKTKLKHFDFFIYTVYVDIYKFIHNISKHVRIYITNEDMLDYINAQKSALKSNFDKVFKKTNFYCIYILYAKNEKTKSEKRVIDKFKAKNKLYKIMTKCQQEIKQCTENEFACECKFFKKHDEWDIYHVT